MNHPASHETSHALSSSIQLRDYQSTLMSGIYEQWQRDQLRVLAQLPTGGGKTILFGAIAQDFACRGEQVLIVAHREELVFQAADKVGKVSGMPVGVIKAGHQMNLDAPIQVASIQTLINRPSLLEHPSLIVIDEAHHSPAGTYREVMSWYPDAYVLGVTATPCRLDGSGFDDLFDQLVMGPTVADLINEGHLSQFKLFADPQPMQVKGVRTQQGDFSTSDLARANDVVELSGNLIHAYQQRAHGRRCIVFAVNIEHSQGIAERYNEAGIPAMHLDGNTPAQERREALSRFEAGELWVLSNCNLFDEGLDIPGIEAIQIARPTKSLVKWLQMIGRALRPAPGKEHAIILDHTKNWAIHGLPTRPRVWTLEGVEEKGNGKPRIKSDGTVTEEPIPLEIHEADAPLEAIEPNPLDEWKSAYWELQEQQQVRGYKKAWIWHRLKDLNPPLEIWQLHAAYCGYKPGWARHQWEAQQQQEAQSIEPNWEDVPEEWRNTIRDMWRSARTSQERARILADFEVLRKAA